MNHTGGRRVLRRASAALSSVSVTQHLGEQVAHAADAANEARLVRVRLNELAQPHDEIIDGARSGELIRGPGTIEDFIAADRLADTARQEPQYGALLVRQRMRDAVHFGAEAPEIHPRAADAHHAAHLPPEVSQALVALQPVR